MFVGTLAASALRPRPARAEEPARIAVDRTASLTWTAALGGAWLAGESFKGAFAPSACRVCDSNAFDDAVRGTLRWANPDAAAATSDVFGYGLVPLFGLGSLYATRGANEAFLDDLLIVAEATVGAGALVQGTKFLVGRQRPFVHALAPNEAGPARDVYDDNLSFYSGHTSVTVALGTSVAMLATLRGHRAAPWLWASGLVAGLATGYLRIAADRHYATDVLTGAAVGAGVGVAVPCFHAAQGAAQSASPALAVAPGAVTLTWRL